MKIDKIEIKEYEKNFIDRTNLGSQKFESRFGWYIKLYSGNLFGVGEAAPIPGISSESHEQAGYALNGFKVALEGLGYNINLEELLLLSEVHGFEVPSVQFAADCAIYDLFSKSSKQDLAEYLNPNYLKSININSIYSDRARIDEINTQFLKIKINELNIFSIKERLDKIISKYPSRTKLRLDFNESLDLVRAIRICKELKPYNIDYIEQPLNREDINDTHDLRMSVNIPIALDEAVTNYKSVENIVQEGAADVIIIKPMLTGNFKTIKKIIDYCRSEGIRTVITSSFETSIAQSHIVNLISALEIKEHCGIYNIKLFKDDFLESINKDQISIPIG